MTINVLSEVGSFAEDKDSAARLRNSVIEPQLSAGKSVILDFGGVELATQSFIHALISSPLRNHGEGALELIEFKSCGRLVRGIVETVVQYSLESLED